MPLECHCTIRWPLAAGEIPSESAGVQPASAKRSFSKLRGTGRPNPTGPPNDTARPWPNGILAAPTRRARPATRLAPAPMAYSTPQWQTDSGKLPFVYVLLLNDLEASPVAYSICLNESKIILLF